MFVCFIKVYLQKTYNMEIQTKIILEGNADDLYVNEGIIKRTRIMAVSEDNNKNFDVEITSYDEELMHEKFNLLLGRKIRVTIETL